MIDIVAAVFRGILVQRPVLILLFVVMLVPTGCTREANNAPKVDTAQRDSRPVAPSDPRFTTIRVDMRTDRIEIFDADERGVSFKSFDRLNAWLAKTNRRLRFAMNAGMYEPDFSPVGLLVQEGREIAPLNLADAAGNFYLKPNGVFFIGEAGPRVVESSEYPSVARGVRIATQSGPLLLRDGVVHPAFNAASTLRLIRNGVGVSGDTAMFVISEQPVSFHEMAVYVRDALGCRDALYLDGVVSSLYSVELGRNDARAELGPIIGVVE